MHRRANENDQIHQQAEAFLESSQVPEELAWAHMIMGVSHERTIDWLAAADSYSKGLALNPRDPHVQYYCNNNLGFSLIQLGRFEEAGPYCKAAIAVYPDRHNAYKNLGLVRQGLGHTLDAAICFANASERCPGDPRAWWFLEQLLTSHPELIPQSNELRCTVERLRRSVENGDVARMQ